MTPAPRLWAVVTMLSDEQLLELHHKATDDAMHAANKRDGFGSNMSRESIVAGLRAVEAAVRADQAIECNNARFDLLRELTAAQATIQRVLNLTGDIGPEARRILSQSPADALQAHDGEVAAKSWDEGALWAAVECGSIDSEANAWLAPGDNPYRTALGVPVGTEKEGDRGRWCHHAGCRHWFEPECSSSCDTISAVSNPPASPDPGVEP